jgi:hypothetical protein
LAERVGWSCYKSDLGLLRLRAYIHCHFRSRRVR